jgi:hypothetical protein
VEGLFCRRKGPQVSSTSTLTVNWTTGVVFAEEEEPTESLEVAVDATFSAMWANEVVVAVDGTLEEMEETGVVREEEVEEKMAEEEVEEDVVLEGVDVRER